MALIKCPECEDNVSSTIIECPTCGFIINKPKRSIFGKIVVSIFIIYTFFFLYKFALFISTEEIPNVFFVIKSFTKVYSYIGIPLIILIYFTRPEKY
jgi:hypothetical protein